MTARKAASDATAVPTDTKTRSKAGTPKRTTPYTVTGISAMITESMILRGVTPVNTCGLDERSRLFAGTLGLLLFFSADKLFSNTEALDELDVRRADKTAGTALNAVHDADPVG